MAVREPDIRNSHARNSTVLVVTLDLGTSSAASTQPSSPSPATFREQSPLPSRDHGGDRDPQNRSVEFALDFGTFTSATRPRACSHIQRGVDVLAISAIYTDDVSFQSDASSCTLAVHESRDVSSLLSSSRSRRNCTH